MSTVKLPNRTAAIAALRSAIQIHSFNGCSGPGKWKVDGQGRTFIALTVTFDVGDFPEHVVADEPWEFWGGEEILASAHLESDRTVTLAGSSALWRRGFGWTAVDLAWLRNAFANKKSSAE